jgi:hypothetical protein
MNVKIKVMDHHNRTATLTQQQAQIVQQTLHDMLQGKLSLRLANDIIISKLADAKQPVQFPS